MKKYLSLILICAMILTMFAGCSKPEDEKTPDDKENIEAEEKESANNANSDKEEDAADDDNTDTDTEVHYLIDTITLHTPQGEHTKTFVYDTNNFAIKVFTIYSGKESINETFEYNENGDLKKTTKNNDEYTYTHTYDEKDNIIKTTINNDIDNYESYEYNNNNQITKTIYHIPNYSTTFIYNYDEKGNLTDETISYSDSSDAYDHKTTYSYDNKGNKTECIIYNGPEANDKKWESYYTYNENGALVSKKQFGYGTDLTYVDYEYTYDENGCLISFKATTPQPGQYCSYSITYTKVNGTLKTTDKQYSFQKSYLDSMLYDVGPVVIFIL